jgi:sugar/nucleoside kinase (ribokinase family)
LTRKRELLVAGSIALDTLEGPFGTVEDELGGSALYFALAASLIMPVRMLAPIGVESRAQVESVIAGRAIDASLVEVLDAPTYRWRARQDPGRNIDLGSRDSIYDQWEPHAPPGFEGWAFVGSVRPDRQAQLATELQGAEMLAADAMLSYVRARPPDAQDVLRLARWYFCNVEEFQALGGEEPESFRRRWSLDGLVVKAGMRGVTAYTARGSVHVPALTELPVVDTTGAGDAIAAGMLAHWLSTGGDADELHESLVWGVACASLTIADIGLRGIVAATREQLDARVIEVKQSVERGRDHHGL